jgi:hypothetical protein
MDNNRKERKIERVINRIDKVIFYKGHTLLMLSNTRIFKSI